MTPRRSTIRDVAALAGVSTATVSNTLNGTKHVEAELRARVEAAAQELSYNSDRAAAQLRSGSTCVIGVLVPDLEDAFFTALVSRLEVMAGADGYDVIIASSRDDVDLEHSRLRALLGWRPAGIVVVPCSNQVPVSIAEEALRMPIVLADRVDGGAHPADVVTIDNFASGALAARHLSDLGHRDVLVAASDLSLYPISERVHGFASVIGSARVIEVGSNAAAAGRILARTLQRDMHPTAIFGLTNVITLGALSAFANQGIEAPGDISLVGFDDYAWMSARKTPLTAIRQPLDEMARAVWERLMARIAHLDGAPRRVTLAPTLEIRASSRDLKTPDTVPRDDSPARPAKPMH